MTDRSRAVPFMRLAQRADEVGETRVVDGGALVAEDVIFTSERRDRYGDVVRMAGADLRNYLANPVVLFSHGATSAACPVVGRGRGIKKTQTASGTPAMSMSIEFASTPLAREVGELWKGGFIRATSIGFQPKNLASLRVIGPDGKPTDDDPQDFLGFMPDGYGFEFNAWEMLENSIVPVPANPDALGRMRGLPEVCRAVGLLHRGPSIRVPSIGRATLHKAMCHGGHCAGCAGEYGEEEPATAAEPTQEDVQASKTWADSLVREAEKVREPLPGAVHKEACPGGHCAGCVGEMPVAEPEESPAPVIDLSADPLRWNRSLPEDFDVETVPLEPSTTEVAFAARFLRSKVCDLSQFMTDIPSVRLGSFLSALEKYISDGGYQPAGVRNISDYGQAEAPPKYAQVQLNSKLARRFMIEGVRFLKDAEGRPSVAIRLWPTYFGIRLLLYSREAEADKAERLLDLTWQHARGAGNFLRGESFSVGGEFLPATSETWDGLYLSPTNERSLKMVARTVNEDGAAADCRGVILMGSPGNGKTLSCRVMRNECAATFVWLSARDFAYLGAFDGLTTAFDLARELAPAILCVEDADSWLDRYTVDLLKTEMDGVARHKGVVTAVTTNFPEALPEALIDRPGRFHDVLHFGAPDAGTRDKMLAAWADGLTPEERAAAVEATDGMSGAHVREVASYAATLARQEGLGIGKALLLAIDKMAEQRRLIDEHAGGGRYRNIGRLERSTPARWRTKPGARWWKVNPGDEKGGKVVHVTLDGKALARHMRDSGNLRDAIDDIAAIRPVSLGALAQALADTSVETCPACKGQAPYHRPTGRFIGHQDENGDRCASKGVTVKPVGLPFARFAERLGDSRLHDVRGGLEDQLASGAASMPLPVALAQLETRAAVTLRAVAAIVTAAVAEYQRAGRVLSRKNEDTISEALAALDAVDASVAAVSQTISQAREALQSVLAAAKPPQAPPSAPQGEVAPAEGRAVPGPTQEQVEVAVAQAAALIADLVNRR